MNFELSCHKSAVCWQIKGGNSHKGCFSASTKHCTQLAAAPALRETCSYQPPISDDPNVMATVTRIGTSSYESLIALVTNQVPRHPDSHDVLIDHMGHRTLLGGSDAFLLISTEEDVSPHTTVWKPRKCQLSISLIKFFPFLFIYWLEWDNQIVKFLSPQGITAARLNRIKVDIAKLQSGKSKLLILYLWWFNKILPDRNRR